MNRKWETLFKVAWRKKPFLSVRLIHLMTLAGIFSMALVWAWLPPSWARAKESQPPNFSAYLPTIAHQCYPNIVPAGALPGQPFAVLCGLQDVDFDSSIAGENEWEDEFDHGLSFATLRHTNYRVFESQKHLYRSAHWRHANHWMVDLVPFAPGAEGSFEVVGGAFLSPNQTFHFENGKLIVEADVAAGHPDYESQRAWPELIVTTAAAPSFSRRDGLYGYDLFPGNWTLGCRLHHRGEPVCTLMDDTIRGATNGGRTWEMSFFQHVGNSVYGGFAGEGREHYWRMCQPGEGDLKCRDRFRMELTATSLTIFVNGIKYFEQTDIPALPNALLEGDLYIYFGSMMTDQEALAIRFHWDRLAVNPNAPPSAAPGFIPPP